MPQHISIYISVKSVLLLLAAGALVWLIANFSSILLMLFLATLLAVAITPLVERLEARRIPRVLAILLIYLALLSIASSGSWDHGSGADRSSQSATDNAACNR